jgi:hypothetical protein
MVLSQTIEVFSRAMGLAEKLDQERKKSSRKIVANYYTNYINYSSTRYVNVKMCPDQKQSIKSYYGIGNGADIINDRVMILNNIGNGKK